MLKSIHEIMQLIGRLDKNIADDFEDQDLDFKQWSTRSVEDNIQKMIDYAVCMANGGGGSVVFGIADRVTGYENTILGVPENLSIHEFEYRVQGETVPPIYPAFSRVEVDHGTGEILIMTVQPGTGLHYFRDGKAVIRTGKECLPLNR